MPTISCNAARETTTYIACPNPKCPQGFKLATSNAGQAMAYFSHHLSCRPLPKSARFAVKHSEPCRDVVREQLDNDDSGGLLAASNLPPEDWRKFANWAPKP